MVDFVVLNRGVFIIFFFYFLADLNCAIVWQCNAEVLRLILDL